MIDNSPFWKRPAWILVLIAMAVAGGLWLAQGRPLPSGWGNEGLPEIRLPEALRFNEAERLFCAESAETGVCRCITEDGQRPPISEEECRRRARSGQTAVGDQDGMRRP